MTRTGKVREELKDHCPRIMQVGSDSGDLLISNRDPSGTFIYTPCTMEMFKAGPKDYIAGKGVAIDCAVLMDLVENKREFEARVSEGKLDAFKLSHRILNGHHLQLFLLNQMHDLKA